MVKPELRNTFNHRLLSIDKYLNIVDERQGVVLFVTFNTVNFIVLNQHRVARTLVTLRCALHFPTEPYRRDRYNGFFNFALDEHGPWCSRTL